MQIGRAEVVRKGWRKIVLNKVGAPIAWLCIPLLVDFCL